jgi:hypothetical protein
MAGPDFFRDIYDKIKVHIIIYWKIQEAETWGWSGVPPFN